ncbi:MAG TPA: PQQ-binding-like beta-propeller repeat protein [Verrucomicrobiae bacterium]|nr:PQQ-binding-like beta-propeller repeat protein [Verrucomicrobiae bacterium]
MRKSVIAAVLAFAFWADAENWPQFRGPTGQGISAEKNLPMHWSADSNLIWKTEIPGEGWSSPIIWNDKAFLTSATERGTKCHVVAIDRKSGKILWDKELFEQVPLRKEGKNSYATPTPVTDGKRVYGVFGDGSVVALTLDGELVWSNRDVQFYSRHGLGASPIVYGDLLIMPYDGSNRVGTPGNWPNNTAEERLGWQIPWDKSFVAALDVNSGKRVWTGKRGMSRIAHATPIVVEHGGKEQIVSIAGDAIQGFDPKTGERLWTVYAQGEGLVPTPVAGDGLILAASGFEKTTLRGVRMGGKGDVTQTHIAWEQKKGVPTQPSPLYVKGHVYAITDGGIATCYKADSGDVIWQERIGGNHSASPVFADGKIYFLSESGDTAIINASPKFRGILATNSINEKCQASMALAQGNIFIRSEKHLFCIGKK